MTLCGQHLLPVEKSCNENSTIERLWIFCLVHLQTYTSKNLYRENGLSLYIWGSTNDALEFHFKSKEVLEKVIDCRGAIAEHDLCGLVDTTCYPFLFAKAPSPQIISRYRKAKLFTTVGRIAFDCLASNVAGDGDFFDTSSLYYPFESIQLHVLFYVHNHPTVIKMRSFELSKEVIWINWV